MPDVSRRAALGAGASLLLGAMTIRWTTPERLYREATRLSVANFTQTSS
jgi:hypothetical protein